jgi:hypothetical protein
MGSLGMGWSKTCVGYTPEARKNRNKNKQREQEERKREKKAKKKEGRRKP